MRVLNSQMIAVFNFIVTVGGSFAFAFKATEYAMEKPDYALVCYPCFLKFVQSFKVMSYLYWRRTANSLLSPHVADCVRRTLTRVKFGEPTHGSVIAHLPLRGHEHGTSANPIARLRTITRTIQAVTKDTSLQAYIRLLTAAVPSNSVFCALGTN